MESEQFKTSAMEDVAKKSLHIMVATQDLAAGQGAVRLKTAQGTFDTPKRHWKRKKAAAAVVARMKAKVWEGFGEAVENDFQAASKRFWKTIW